MPTVNQKAARSPHGPRDDAEFRAAQQVYADRLKQRPRLFEALAQDAIWFSVHRAEAVDYESAWARRRYQLRLLLTNRMYIGLALYRLRVALRQRGVPFLPALINLVCGVSAGIHIGDGVVMKAGVYVPHGQIVLDGIVLVGRQTVLCPWITIGTQAGSFMGPELGDGVFVGTGAKILGPIKVGDGAHVGANAVVVRDVPPHVTAVGVPATIVATED